MSKQPQPAPTSTIGPWRTIIQMRFDWIAGNQLWLIHIIVAVLKLLKINIIKWILTLNFYDSERII